MFSSTLDVILLFHERIQVAPKAFHFTDELAKGTAHEQELFHHNLLID